MRYLLLIYQDKVAHSQWSEQQLAEEYQAYSNLDGEFQKLGAEVQGGEALMPTQTARGGGAEAIFMLLSDTEVSWRLQHTDEGGNR